MREYSTVEICAGAGGQALGLELAGFKHKALVEIDKNACSTLRYNRMDWKVLEMDVRNFSTSRYQDIDLFAGGVPCPPFSIAGKQLGNSDERDLFPEAIRMIAECRPKAVLLENVKGLLGKKFDEYRNQIVDELDVLGYTGEWKLVISSNHGVPQLRPRAIFIAFRKNIFPFFEWPDEKPELASTVGEVLYEEMASNGWKKAREWKDIANNIAPTLVGGSKKHGGADLGPTRAKKAWEQLGVDGKGLANEPPHPDFEGMPRLTVNMAALIQGFPSEWKIVGKKTPAYRQVGNAFPPPVAEALGKKIISAIQRYELQCQKEKVPEPNYGNISLTT